MQTEKLVHVLGASICFHLFILHLYMFKVMRNSEKSDSQGFAAGKSYLNAVHNAKMLDLTRSTCRQTTPVSDI